MNTQDKRFERVVFQTDESGFYVGHAYAHPDPQNLGNWLIPAGCVEVEPPFIPSDKKAHWAGYKWKLISK